MRWLPAGLLAAVAVLDPRPATAEEVGRWIASLNGAAASIDDRPTRFFWGARLGGAVNTRGTLVVEVGYGAAGGDFSILDAGFEYRTAPGRPVGGFVRLQLGKLSEDYGDYVFAGLGAGVIVRVAPRLDFRAGIILGGHGPASGGPRGPVLSQGGLALRF